MSDPRQEKAAIPPGSREHEILSRPAQEWVQELESMVTLHSERREAVRLQLRSEADQLRLMIPPGQSQFSPRAARELARAEVLGADWPRARERVRHARQRITSVRRQLRALKGRAEVSRERRSAWVYGLVSVPFHAWQARPLRRQLRQAQGRCREALVVVRQLRSQMQSPEIRSRIHRAVAKVSLHQEQLTFSVRSLRETEARLSLVLSNALCLVPRLRDQGGAMVAMEVSKNPELRATTPPIPRDPLAAPRLTSRHRAVVKPR